MKTTVLFFIFNLSVLNSFGQIFANNSFSEGITISPDGIKSRLPLSSDVTNVGLGDYTLHSVTTGTRNVAIGYWALNANTSGSQGTAVGYYSLIVNKTGLLNSALGSYSLGSNINGNENTSFGNYALEGNTSLSRNLAIGYQALHTQSYDGGNNSDNIAIGSAALFNNNPTDGVNGRQNIAVGSNALTINTTGARNIGLGQRALYKLLSGNDNIAMGNNSLSKNIDGSKNVVLGKDALSASTGSGNVAIGYKAGENETGSNKLYIGESNNDFDSPLIGGDFAAKKVSINRNLISTANPNDFANRSETLQVEGDAFKTVGNGNWIFPSDRRLKKNIVSLSSQKMLQKVLQMQGVTYQMKDESQKGIQYGFIAQDLREIFPSKIKENKSGYLSADYGSYDAMIVEALKALNKKINTLKADKKDLETEFVQLAMGIDVLLTKAGQLETVQYHITKTTSVTKK